MRVSLFLTLLVPALSFAMDFPTEEFAQVALRHGTGAAICESWLEPDGEPRMLVALRDSVIAGATRLAIMGLNEVIWESEPIPGGSTVGKRIVFSEQDVRFYTGWLADTSGWVREFRGDGFADSHDYRIGSYWTDNHRGIDLAHDNRRVTHFIDNAGLMEDAPSIYLSRAVYSEDYDEVRGFYSNNYSQLVELSVENGELTIIGQTEIITDCKWVVIPGFDQQHLLTGSWSSRSLIHVDGYWNTTVLTTPLSDDSVRYRNTLCSAILPGPVSGWCYFFSYRRQGEGDDRCLALSPRFDPNQGQYGQCFPTVFELAGDGWPIASSVALDNIVQWGSGPIRFWQTINDTVQQFGLIPVRIADDDHIKMVVIDLQYFTLAELVDFVPNTGYVETVDMGANADPVLACLFTGQVKYYRVGSLNAPQSDTPNHPLVICLQSPFPNPFNSSTTISYTLPRPGRYALDVVDITGRLVTRLSDGWREAGSYREVWDGGGIGSGTYLLRLRAGNNEFTNTIELIK